MRITRWLLLAAFIAAPAGAQQIPFQKFSMTIDNAQSTAAGNCLIGSTATGSGTATLELNTLDFAWNITFGNNGPSFNNGLLDNGAEVAAHFHDAPPGVNGPVEVVIALGSPKMGSQVLSAGQAAALQAGNFYVNIHSQNCVAGEIRGQVIPGDVVPTLSEWGLIVLALLGLTVGTVAIGRRQLVAAGAGSSVHLSGGSPLFVWDTFRKILLGTSTLAVAGMAGAIWTLGSLSALDAAGTIVSAVLVAYLIHLWVVYYRER